MMYLLSNSSVVTERRSTFKKTVGGVDGRRRRGETTLEIRKIKKDENLRKRRQMPTSPSHPAANMSDHINSLGWELRNRLAAGAPITEQVKGFREIVEKNPSEYNVTAMIDAGLLPIFVECLKSTSTSLVFESQWVLTNIACFKAGNLLEGNAIEPLVLLLVHDNPSIREQAAWCLANIAGEAHQHRDYLWEIKEMPIAV